MKNQRWLWGTAGWLAGGLLIPAISYGSPAQPMSFSGAAAESTQISPTAPVPWFFLPGRYLLSGGYYVKLSIQEMRIDHMTDETRCTRRSRNFMISASFLQPIGHRLFSSQFELPLISADRVSLSRLAPASVGDYVMHFSNSPTYSSVAGLTITARF